VKRKPVASDSPSHLVNELRRVYLEAGEPTIKHLSELSGVSRQAIGARLGRNTDARELVAIERLFASLGYTLAVVKVDERTQKKSGEFLEVHPKSDAPTS
jgi:hypothetical protein